MAGEDRQTITARDLATLSDLDGLSISPDGRLAVFQIRRPDPNTNLYDQAWYVVDTRGGEARRLAAGGDPIQPKIGGRVMGFIRAVPPVWSADGSWVAYVRKDRGRTQVWRARIDGGDAEALTGNDGDVTGLFLSADGRRLLYRVESSHAQLDAALRDEGRSGFLYDRRFFPSHSALPLFAKEPTSDLWVYDLADRREQPAGPAEAAEYESLLVSTPGREAVSTTGARASVSGDRRIAVQLAPADERIVCEVDECAEGDLRGLWWRNERELIFARRESLPGVTLYAWRVGEHRVRRILRTADLLVTSRSFWNCAVAQDRLVCFQEKVNYPRRLVAIDLDRGSIDVLHDPNPAFAHFDLGPPPERVEIPVASSVRTYGHLVLPPAHRRGKRLPLVIATYRCNEFLRGGTGDEYPIFPLAAQGFAVLCYEAPIDNRALQPQLDSFEAFEDWARGPGDPMKRHIQKGLDAALWQLVDRGIADPLRVGATGLSYGGETVMYALFNMRHLTAAIASGTEIGPASPFLYGPAGRDDLVRFGLGSPLDDRWRELSVTHNTHRVRAPLLLNVPDREMISGLHPMFALEQAGRSVETYVFPDEYHIKWQPAHRLAIYNRNIDWMNFWLRGVEDPAPAKAEQYQRWRAMRVKQCELFKGDDAPWYCRQ